MSISPVPSAGGFRLKLADFPDGAVAINLSTGAYFRLNPTACDIGRQLQAGQPVTAIAEALASRYALPADQAEAAVTAVLASLQAVEPPQGGNPLSFRRDGERWLLHWDARAVLAVDECGLDVSAVTAISVEEAAAYLLWATPHLLALQGRLVLHAAAVRRHEAVTAFCGPSGMGKTTLARTFTAAGAAPVSEDLVVVQLSPQGVAVALEAEAWLRGWAAEQAARLASGESVATQDLASNLPTTFAPLSAIWFIERLDQAQPTLAKTRFTAPDGLARLLHNSFAELPLPTVWEPLFDSLAQLAAQVPLFHVALPHGLDILEQAVVAYSRMVNGNAPPSV
ncbi:MAG: PqqD family peptide modification chaperone [Planctomycetia bacterium]|nr:PqqD family peptide modification chaperone [Planctomycetia bacterium]